MSLSDYDLYLFKEGNHFQSYTFLGAHCKEEGGVIGVRFSVWAPKAKRVAVVGTFNQWDQDAHPMDTVKNSGIWSVFIPRAGQGDLYKYAIETSGGHWQYKADPFAFFSEMRPKTASIVHSLPRYSWQDSLWQKQKPKPYQEPVAVYEVHLGSWRRKGDGSFYTYQDLAKELVPYVKDMGFTHLELMPVAEHPLDRSWGYQATGYFSVTSRYGSPQDFMYLVDTCHAAGIGVILDWVPGHFCKDDHGLRCFDGSPLYEYEEEWKAENRGWGTCNFDLGKPEVQSFLISNAMFWFREFHIDGLRVDAVANMLYLDYDREEGSWRPNRYGGRENLEAIEFLKTLNQTVFASFPRALMIAEESTQWPLITRPVHLGGLGFNYKWNMGWMNDTLRYMGMDPVHRKWNHNLLTFSFFYAFSENFLLPLSHDEVVHGKKSLLEKMPGDDWQKFANLRLYLAYLYTHPGKKLLFMGGELGQRSEWYEGRELDWALLNYGPHEQLQTFVGALNALYRSDPSLYRLDHEEKGFYWIDPHDYSQSIITFVRQDGKGNFLLVLLNFTPIPREQYRIGVPREGLYEVMMDSDNSTYGGSSWQKDSYYRTQPIPWHGQPFSMVVGVPPLAAVLYRGKGMEV